MASTNESLIAFLMDTTKLLLDLRRSVSQTPGSNFNIFSVLRDESDEVHLHSRFLYEILNPQGNHGMGDAFLKAFFKTVLERNLEVNLVTKVQREVVIPKLNIVDKHTKPLDGGRIDLLISGDGYCFPLEIKIYAGDQPNQMARYIQFAQQECPKSEYHHVYYLTLDGHDPSEDSLGQSSDEEWSNISFSVEIKKWLSECCSIAWNVPALVEVFRQYEALIDKLTNNSPKDAFMVKIEELVNQSSENFISAVAISKTLTAVKAQMMARVLDNIHTHLKEKWDELINILQWSHRDEADAFYSQLTRESFAGVRRRAWPSITAILPEASRGTSLNIAIRIEIDYRLFWGVIFWEGDWKQVPERAYELLDAFGDKSSGWNSVIHEHQRGWWIWCDYLPDVTAEAETNNDDKLDFVMCNGRYVNLYDPDHHDEIMHEIFDVLDDNIPSVIETGLPAYRLTKR